MRTCEARLAGLEKRLGPGAKDWPPPMLDMLPRECVAEFLCALSEFRLAHEGAQEGEAALDVPECEAALAAAFRKVGEHGGWGGPESPFGEAHGVTRPFEHWWEHLGEGRAWWCRAAAAQRLCGPVGASQPVGGPE